MIAADSYSSLRTLDTAEASLVAALRTHRTCMVFGRCRLSRLVVLSCVRLLRGARREHYAVWGAYCAEQHLSKVIAA